MLNADLLNEKVTSRQIGFVYLQEGTTWTEKKRDTEKSFSIVKDCLEAITEQEKARYQGIVAVLKGACPQVRELFLNQTDTKIPFGCLKKSSLNHQPGSGLDPTVITKI